ncbi:uncharacterized protein LOC125674106 [Ostrea edulis]|uniref:uncharacterized protein LOC125674106 n=1 Tax=Ostrea edulis TaxID=37623 RepID=UPI002094C608|nr:uncharacterized protein LOC125674106 [Ostrea edulis]
MELLKFIIFVVLGIETVSYPHQITTPPVDENDTTTQKAENGINYVGTPYPVTTQQPDKTTTQQLHQTTTENHTNTPAPPQAMPETPENNSSNDMSAMSDTKTPTDNSTMTVAIGSVFLFFLVMFIAFVIFILVAI